MVQQLLDTVYEYDTLELDTDQETRQGHADCPWQAAAEVLDEAEARLRQAERSSDLAGVREACDDLFFDYSKQLLSGLSTASQNPAEGPAFRGSIAHEFMAAADAVRDNGWAVLAWQPTSEQLVVIKSHQRETPTVGGVTPILALDVQDDAYYLWPLTS